MRRLKGGCRPLVAVHGTATIAPVALLLLLALVALPQQALAVAPTVTWGAFTTGGTYNYKWTLTETVNGAPAPGPSVVRLDKGVKQNVPYQLAYTRTLDQSSAQVTVSGSVTITNANTGTDTLTVASVTLSLTPTGGTPTSAPIACQQLNTPLPPGGAVSCTITNAPYTGFLTAGTATVSIAFTDTATPLAASPITSTSPTTFSFENVQGNFATATLTNTFDLSPLDQLYTGFTGFVRTSVWRILDPGTEIPATTGVTVMDSGTKEFTYVAGGFVVCTDLNGVSLTNTATLTPQASASGAPAGTPITVTGTVSVQVTGCNVAPDVTFQILQTWAAQSFSWSLTKTAQQSAFTVDQNVGSVPMVYTLRAVAQPTTGSYYVSGALFVNNNRPGILNIARIGVQLSTGQQAVPTCTLTAPYVAADGLVWGAANAGGSVTQNPCITTGGILPTNGITPSSIVAGTIASTCTFVIPEYASASCAFNMSLGTSPPGGAIQIMPQLSWGFGGQYLLNTPPQQTLNFAPADNFFPVGNCISLTDMAQAPGSSIQLSNGGPNNQQVCVEGKVQPFQQPAPISYTVTATVNPSTTPDCQPGGTKTYSITNRATATPIGGTGAPVTAQADPAVTLTVNCAKPSVTPVTPASVSDAANLNVVVGGFQTFTSGAHTWTVTKSADTPALAVRVGDLPAKVTYTVTVTKGAAVDSKHYVFGTITITNPGTKPVDLSLVAVTAGSASVPATCPPDAKQALPSAPVVCTFNVTWNNGANSGSLGARVDTPEASFYGAPAAFDFTNPRRGGTRGLTANVYDDLSGTAPPNATGVPTVWYTPDADAPPPKSDGLPLTTADTRTYTYTVQVGPFADKGSCGSYRLGNIATVEPSDGSSPAVTQEAVVSVSVVGCGSDTTLQSLGAGGSSDLKVAVTKVTATQQASNAWAVNGTATPPALSLQYDQTAPAEFALMVRKLPSASYEVSGTVTVTNTNPSAAAQLAGLTVAMEPRGGGAAETVDAVCGAQGTSFTIAPGSTVTCSFTGSVAAGATPGGDATAIATDGRNLQAESAPAPYNLGTAAATAADGAPACAQVTAGLVVGTAVWKADGTNAGAVTQTRVCESNALKVPVTVGPLAPSQCGASKIYALASVVPLNGGGGAAAPVDAMVPLPLTVTGCPKDAPGAAQPLVLASPPKPEVQEAYTWTAKLMSDANGGPVTVTPGAPAKVTFMADSERSPVMRSLSLTGKVTLEAPSADPLTVASANVAIYDGREKYTLVPLTCPGAAAPGSPVKLPGKGAPVVCTYAAKNLAVNGGAVLPIVVVGTGGAPAPADPVAYSLKGAPRNIVGDCADSGTELVLREAGPVGKRATWQPSLVGQALSSGSDCEGGNKQRFVLNFGGDAASTPPACGDYVFTGTLTLLPNNGDSVEGTETFPVKVAC